MIHMKQLATPIDLLVTCVILIDLLRYGCLVLKNSRVDPCLCLAHVARTRCLILDLVHE
jgi:hypothetical protein